MPASASVFALPEGKRGRLSSAPWQSLASARRCEPLAHASIEPAHTNTVANLLQGDTHGGM